jgi:hypothetical protein
VAGSVCIHLHETDEMSMKVAVIGSGAAALGVLDFFSTLGPSSDITLIDRERRGSGELVPRWTQESLRDFYSRIRSEYGHCFPPPKTNFGVTPPKQRVEGWGKVWDGGHGGLTSIWGLSALPFSARELEGWPFGRSELDPHYASIAKRIGIAGERDSLNEWLGDDFVNRPPIKRTPLATLLAEKINSCVTGTTFRFIAGASRLAIETRSERSNACVSCGECMIGCPQQAMYSTVRDVDAWRRSSLISRVVVGRVLAVDSNPPLVTVETEDGRRQALGPYDRVYVCAGCINTTEIALRSLGRREPLRIVDNSAYTFPAVYTGPALPKSVEQHSYLGLANIIVHAVPRVSTAQPVQIQIYPVFDHLWRYFTPFALWRAVEPLGRALRRRVLLARVFLHGDHSQRYVLDLQGSRPAMLSLVECGTMLCRIPDLWSDIRSIFAASGFAVPMRPTRQRTSSHYSSSLPLGKNPVGIDGSITPGVYLCDSAVFPTAPATSPTFTIMANARRIAAMSLRR